MKTLTSLSITTLIAIMSFNVIPSSSHASVPEAGTFVPSVCSPVTANINRGDVAPTNPISELCIGQVAQDDRNPATGAVTLQLADGNVKTFKIVQTADLLMAFSNGNTISIFSLVAPDGEQSALRILRARDNSLIRATGNFNGEAYTAAAFQAQVVIQ